MSLEITNRLGVGDTTASCALRTVFIVMMGCQVKAEILKTARPWGSGFRWVFVDDSFLRLGKYGLYDLLP